MKKLIFLFIPFLLPAQLVNETFTDFTMGLHAETKHHMVYNTAYHDSVHEDLAENVPQAGVFPGYVTLPVLLDSMVGPSVNYDGGNSLVMDAGVQHGINHVDNANYVDPLLSDFTIEAVFLGTTDDALGTIYGVINITGAGNPWFRALAYDDSMRLAMQSAAQSVLNYDFNGSNHGGWTILDDTWHYFAMVVNRTTGFATCYIDADSQMISIADFAGESLDVHAGGDISVGNAGSNFDGYFQEIRMSHVALTHKEVMESYALANGWYSLAGKVMRENWGFSQGFYDSETIYFPVSNTSNVNSFFEWYISFDAKGTKAGDVVTVQIGSGSPVNQTLTTTNTSYKLSLGTVTLSADSLWFSASSGDSIYIDNVYVDQRSPINTRLLKLR